MPSRIGKQAVVVGAGIGGLTAARVVADCFERVIVLDRDALPERAEPRAGVPQSKHIHGLVAEVQHLLKPHSVFQDPELRQRIHAVPAAG
jgi:hypothetical protein